MGILRMHVGDSPPPPPGADVKPFMGVKMRNQVEQDTFVRVAKPAVAAAALSVALGIMALIEMAVSCSACSSGGTPKDCGTAGWGREERVSTCSDEEAIHAGNCANCNGFGFPVTALLYCLWAGLTLFCLKRAAEGRDKNCITVFCVSHAVCACLSGVCGVGCVLVGIA